MEKSTFCETQGKTADYVLGLNVKTTILYLQSLDYYYFFLMNEKLYKLTAVEAAEVDGGCTKPKQTSYERLKSH